MVNSVKYFIAKILPFQFENGRDPEISVKDPKESTLTWTKAPFSLINDFTLSGQTSYNLGHFMNLILNN